MASIKRQIKELYRTPLFKDNMWELHNEDFPDTVLLAQSVTFGYRTITTEEDKILRKKYIIGYENPSDVTIEFIETEDFRVTSFFDDWEESFLNRDGLFVSGVDPRKNFRVQMYKFSGFLSSVLSALAFGFLDTEELLNTYVLKGMIPTERKPLDLKYDGGSDLYLISVTFSLEDVIRLES